MKAKCIVVNCLLILTLIWSDNLVAQSDSVQRLEITTAKTTVIVSHYPIRSVDRGSKDILVEKVRGADTVLEVKAARSDFPESNLTIITGDGQVHMFSVTYNAQPTFLLINLNAPRRGISSGGSISTSISLTDADYEVLSDSVMQQPERFKRVRDQSFGVRLNLLGIWVHEDVLFFRFRLKNRSNIGYDVSQINFYIRDQKQSKRTASQDLGMVPLSINGEHIRVNGKATINFVAALPKFTIPNKKVLFVLCKEDRGGRLLRIRVKNKRLMRAREI